MRFFCVLCLWMFLSEFETSSAKGIQGYIGESTTISCSYTWASTNIKYFCRNPCKDEKDTLIKSGQSPKGRYTLKDSGNGMFSVTIADLQESDSGTYKCAVDRLGLDTYEEVKLTVKSNLKVTQPRTMATQSTPKIRTKANSAATTQNTPTSTGSVNTPNPTEINTVPVHYILYASVGLAVVVIICAVGLIVVCRRRKSVKKPRRSVARSIYTAHHSEAESAVYENRPNDKLYATMKKPRKISEEESQSDAVYENLHLNTTQGDLIYGNVY